MAKTVRLLAMEVRVYLEKAQKTGFPLHITGINSVVKEVVGSDEELQARVRARLGEEDTLITRIGSWSSKKRSRAHK